jgi:hypothetical protein
MLVFEKSLKSVNDMKMYNPDGLQGLLTEAGLEDTPEGLWNLAELLTERKEATATRGSSGPPQGVISNFEIPEDATALAFAEALDRSGVKTVEEAINHRIMKHTNPASRKSILKEFRIIKGLNGKKDPPAIAAPTVEIGGKPYSHPGVQGSPILQDLLKTAAGRWGGATEEGLGRISDWLASPVPGTPDWWKKQNELQTGPFPARPGPMGPSSEQD